MNEKQSKLDSGMIQFHQWCPPPLEPAEYYVVSNHTVPELNEADSEGVYDNSFKFSVAGPRFALDPSEVYSVYPPKNYIGDFANALPHVVFTRRTLPWERTLKPGARTKNDQRPWMALLVYSASDFAGSGSAESDKNPDPQFPDLVPRKVGELINPKGDGWVGPVLLPPNDLQDYESEDDICNTVDIPWNLFQATAPSYEDTAYLGHVREVNTGAKETLSFLADGWFSVVLANRFPKPEQPMSVANFGDFASFVTKLRSHADPVSKFLLNKFSQPAQNLLKGDSSDSQVEQKQKTAAITELNRIVQGKSIYDPKRFAGVPLSETTVRLQDKRPQGSEVTEFNRMLLQDAFPGQIVNSPPLAVENRVYLVSLEGMKDFLPGSGKPAANKPVRLAVLSSWRFHCRSAFAFKDLMDKMDVKRFCLPFKPESGDLAETKVQRAFEQGYAALNHSTRLGEKAVSWYRGPLVPLHLVRKTKYKFRVAADAAMRYSPLSGMMDVTYASAFQLGRLLALQDRHFANTLYAYRNRVQRQINQVVARKHAHFVLGGTDSGEANSVMSTYLLQHLKDPGKTTGKSSWDTPEFSVDNGKPDTASGNGSQKLSLTSAFDLKIPKTIRDWLARLLLLYRLPFTNLVPDKRMLPPDSLRFFYLDPGWLKCLMEGACSVGRSSDLDQLVDEHLRDKFLEFALAQSSEVRKRPEEEDEQTDADEEIDVTQKVAKDVLPNWPLTGFLMRSSVVEGWQGLEMRSWGWGWSDRRAITSNSAANPSIVTTPVPHGLTDNDRILILDVPSSTADINGEHTVKVVSDTTFSVPIDAGQHASKGGSFSVWSHKSLNPLRIDRLAPDVMLCIFNGKVDRIEVKQPPEGMHFGASPQVDSDDNPAGFKRFHLRRLNDGGGAGPGDQLGADSGTPLPLREDQRVVNAAQLATVLASRLNTLNARKTSDPFTSADFGVEMVESPGRVTFDIDNKDDHPS